MKPLDLIAFDGDDTLWHNERSYREARDRFRRLLSRAGVALSSEEIEIHVNRTEEANLPYYGYGVSSFVLSLAETAQALQALVDAGAIAPLRCPCGHHCTGGETDG